MFAKELGKPASPYPKVMTALVDNQTVERGFGPKLPVVVVVPTCSAVESLPFMDELVEQGAELVGWRPFEVPGIHSNFMAKAEAITTFAVRSQMAARYLFNANGRCFQAKLETVVEPVGPVMEECGSLPERPVISFDRMLL